MITAELRTIHRFIAFIHVITLIYFFIFNTVGIKVFRYSTYFETIPPVTILSTTLKNNGAFVFSLLFCIFDTCFEDLNERIMISLGNSTDEYLFKTYKIPAYALRILLKIFNVIMYWLRHANTVIFVKSQLSYGIAFAVTDVVVSTWLTVSAFRSKDIMNKDVWKDFLGEIVLVQIIMIPFFPIVLFIVNADSGGYFNPGPDLPVFGMTVDSNTEYAALMVFLFLDQLLRCTVKDNIDAWYFNIVQNKTNKNGNSSNIQYGGSDDSFFKPGVNNAEFFGFILFASRSIIDWIQSVFVIRFLFQQYFVIVIYILADIVGGIINMHRRYEIKEHHTNPYLETFRPGSSNLMTILGIIQTLETVALVVAYYISESGVNSYLTWENPLYFGVAIPNHHASVGLIFLTIFMRVSQTLYEKVIVPDYYHYTYNRHNMKYSENDSDEFDYEVFLTTVITRTSSWFFFLFSLELITAGSVKYTVILAVIDILLSLLIIYSYIREKSRLLLNIEYVHIINENKQAALLIQQQSTKGNMNSNRKRPLMNK